MTTSPWASRLRDAAVAFYGTSDPGARSKQLAASARAVWDEDWWTEVFSSEPHVYGGTVLEVDARLLDDDSAMVSVAGLLPAPAVAGGSADASPEWCSGFKLWLRVDGSWQATELTPGDTGWTELVAGLPVVQRTQDEWPHDWSERVFWTRVAGAWHIGDV